MEVKQAVAVAKKYYEDVFSEAASLEEVWFDDSRDVWCITLGVRRRLIREKSPSILEPFGQSPAREALDYKIVRVNDKSGAVESVRLRENERAA